MKSTEGRMSVNETIPGSGKHLTGNESDVLGSGDEGSGTFWGVGILPEKEPAMKRSGESEPGIKRSNWAGDKVSMADAWWAKWKLVESNVGRWAGARLAGPCGCCGEGASISFSLSHEALCPIIWHALHDLSSGEDLSVSKYSKWF